MTWTATVISLAPTPNGLEATCILTDGVSQKRQQSFQTDGTTANLTRQGQSAAATIDAIHTKPDLVVGQVIDITPLVPPTPPQPTALQVQEASWLTARSLAQSCRRGLDEHIPGYDQARLDSAISARDKLYDVSFERDV